MNYNYRPGSIRYFDTIGNDYVVVDPHNRMYGASLFVATEYWDDATSSWKKIEITEGESE